MNKVLRTGWGRNFKSQVILKEITDFNTRDALATGPKGLPVGLGRSYGDSSLNSFGISWKCESLKTIQIDLDGLTAVCGSGVTIGELEDECIKVGLFPRVVPGTEFVTIGGAIASNVHGKSHEKFGNFGDQVSEIELMGPTGVIKKLYPQGKNQDLFWATVGGMGLTGIIVSAKLNLMSIESAYVVTEEIRVFNFEQVLTTLEEFSQKYLYVSAWIDVSGNYCGRGLVNGANHAKVDELSSKRILKTSSPLKKKKVSLPDIFPENFLNKWTIFLFNSFWFYKPIMNGEMKLKPYLHPLDSITNWNRVYGRNGLLQYQILVPFGHEDFFYQIFQKLSEIKATSFLTVLKRFGKSHSRYLSFSKPGWTLSIDLSASDEKIVKVLQSLDEQLVQIGGRVYLTKDSCLISKNFEVMYPEYQSWLEIKREVDPENYWQSDQSIRIGLIK